MVLRHRRLSRWLAFVCLLGAPVATAGGLCDAVSPSDFAACRVECADTPARPTCLLVRRFGAPGLEVYRRAASAGPGATDAAVSSLATDVVGQSRALDLVQFLDITQMVFRDHGVGALGPEVRGELAAATTANLALPGLVREGRFKEALASAEQVLAAREAALGGGHPFTAESMNNLAYLLGLFGRDAEAETWHRRALAARRKALGDSDIVVGNSLNNLGVLLEHRGRFDEALETHHAALPIYVRVLGPAHPLTAGVQNNLAVVTTRLGRLDAARRWLDQAVSTLRLTRGPADPATLQATGNLGGLLDDLGELAAAERTLRGVLDAGREALGRTHPINATTLNNLARVLTSTGRPAEAATLYEEALGVLRGAYGDGHPDVASVLQSLAAAENAAGHPERALSRYQDALARALPALGPDHWVVATIWNNLGALFVDVGRLDEGRALLERARLARERLYGDWHPRVADTVGNLVVAAWSQGELDRARALQPKVLAIGRDHFQRNLDGADSDLAVLAFLRSVRPVFDVSLSLFDQPGDAELMFGEVLVWQGAGALAESIWHDTRRVVANGGAEAAAAFQSVRELDQERLRLTMAPAASPADAAARREALEALSKAATGARSRLEQLVPGLSASRLPLAAMPSDVCTALGKAQATLLDVVRYDRFVPRHAEAAATRTGHYDAFVVRPGPRCAFTRVSLGTAAVIDSAVDRFRAAAELAASCEGARCATAYRALDDARHALTTLLLTPLGPLLPDEGTLWYVPDGRLSEVPLAVLGDGKRFLVERLAIATLPYPAAVIGAVAAVGEDVGTGALIVGDVDYVASTGTRQDWYACASDGCHVGGATKPPPTQPSPPPNTLGDVASRSAAVCGYGASWASLSPTEAAGVATTLAMSLPGVVMATGSAATEPLVGAALSGHRLLHFATHGFFSPAERCAGAIDGASDPLRLSAVVLAGASGPPGRSAPVDGLLTARDIAATSLGGTELVVLSACETGRGEVVAGEGVLGLARSFIVAGAHGAVASLWSVPNDETSQLFDAFYPAWLGGASPPEALRTAQRALIDRLREEAPETLASPALWGAFVVLSARPR